MFYVDARIFSEKSVLEATFPTSAIFTGQSQITPLKLFEL